MLGTKPIQLRGKPIAGGRVPAICTPIVGRTRADIFAELTTALAAKPDIIEWRVDFFGEIADAPAVIETGRSIKEQAGDIPILFTRRNVTEGGEKIAASEAHIVSLYAAVCESGVADAVDYELSNAPDHREAIRATSRAHDVAMVMSYHNFSATPPAAELEKMFAAMAQADADVGKIAVMPKSPADVLALLSATQAASDALAIPLIAMAMGEIGALSRICGHVFGSALTFAVAGKASAPGQIPIGELRVLIAGMRKAMGEARD